MTSIQAIIFDLDGVIVDSEPWWAAGRVEVEARFGGVWRPADEAAMKGRNSREWSVAMADRLGGRVDPEVLEAAVVTAIVERYAHDAPPAIPAGVAAARRLSGRYRLAIASSAHPRVISAALEATGLRDRFEALVSADEVGVGKPAPDVYLEAARRLSVVPAAALVVEDAGVGVRAARAAGMRVVLVPTEAVPPSPADRSLADLVLASLDALDEATIEGLAAGPRGSPTRPSTDR